MRYTSLRHFFVSWLLPPRVTYQLQKTVGNKFSKRATIPLTTDDLQELRFVTQAGPYWIPIERLRYSTGVSFTTHQHHFLRYLDSGEHALQSFYDTFQPSSALEALFLERRDKFDPNSLVGLRDLNYRLPWHPWSPTAPPRQDENELPISAGAQTWGPVSDAKFRLETSRLTSLRQSIQKHRFDWYRMSDDIAVYLLLDDAEGLDVNWCAVVINGGHRVALLAHEGHQFCPVTFSRDWPREVRLSDLDSWPGVVDGRFSSETAHHAFKAFFREPNKILLRGWC